MKESASPNVQPFGDLPRYGIPNVKEGLATFYL
jgi:hypothetical protein